MIITSLNSPLNLKTLVNKDEKYKKNEYLENKKSFLHEIKSIFTTFLELSVSQI